MSVDDALQQLLAAHPRVAGIYMSGGGARGSGRALLNQILSGYEQALEDFDAAENTRRYLAEASMALGSSLDYESTLAIVARLLVPHLADWCAVDMVEADGSYRRLAVAHVDPAKVALAWELERRYGFPPDAPQGAAKILRSGQAELYEEIPDALLAEVAADPEHLALLRSLGLRSGMIVPLIARGRTLGAISLGTSESGRRLGAADLALAEDLAARAALSVDNARLYTEAQEAVQHKDQSLALLDTLLENAPVGLGFWDRDLRYVRINAALAAINGRTPEDHIGRRISEVLPDIGEEVALDFRRVLECGEPLVNQEVSGETPAALGQRRYWLASYYPVRSSDGLDTLGVGGVVTEITERKQAEQAMRARARQQAVVAELGMMALSGDSLDALMSSAVTRVAEALEVEYCEVLALLPDGKTLQLRAGVGWKQGLVGRATVGAERQSQAGYTLFSNEPVIVRDLRTETRFDGPALLLEHNVVSGMTVIIHGEQRSFGVLGAHTATPRTFTEEDANFLQAVANVLAAAIARMRSEEELRHSRDQLAIILRGVTDGIIVQEPSGKLVYANAAAARLIGYSSAGTLQAASTQEVMQRFEVMDESGRPLQLAELPGRRALQGEPEVQTLLRFRVVATGEERWSVVHATPVLDEWRQVKLAINIFHEVTEQRRTEENLRFLAEASGLLSSSLDYRTTLSELARLVVPRIADWCTVDVLEQDGAYHRLAVAHVDPAKVELARELQHRYPIDPNARRGAPQVIRTSQSELYSDLSDTLLAVAAQDVAHLELLRRLGFKSVMIVPLTSGGHTLGAITFVSAESGRRFGAADLQFAEDLARRAGLAVHNARLFDETRNAVHARDEFLSIAAHELKTPVTSLLGYSQVLQRRLARENAANERDQRALKVIGEQAQRLGRLISLLLDLSRIQTGHFTLERKPIDVGALVSRVVEDANSALDRHALDLVCADDALIIHGDDLRLEQMFQNVIQNAIKYSPAGGRVTVCVERRGEDAAISVADEGIGIPAAAQAKLFQRFYRATNVAGSDITGLGIGLYVVREIATRHGGTVEVDSEEGKGSTFTIRLPLTKDDQP